MLKTGLGQSRVERQMVKKMLQLALPGDPLVERLGHGIDAQGQVSTEAQQQEVALEVVDAQLARGVLHRVVLLTLLSHRRRRGHPGLRDSVACGPAAGLRFAHANRDGRRARRSHATHRLDAEVDVLEDVANAPKLVDRLVDLRLGLNAVWQQPAQRHDAAVFSRLRAEPLRGRLESRGRRRDRRARRTVAMSCVRWRGGVHIVGAQHGRHKARRRAGGCA
mmetsp:Transcript_21158/g.63359  ORF Transcript_21158/g.63359 Transcript_21158/m.63359 type:complete len:221 (+) Transcript_21158:241-903(+)